MALQSVSMFVIIVLAVALSWQYSSVNGLNVNLLEYACNTFSHSANTDAEKACDAVFEYIRKHTADSGYSVQNQLKIGDDSYYGHGACNGNINQDECTRCVGDAHDWAVELCIFSNGVHVKLGDCRVPCGELPFGLELTVAMAIYWCDTARGLDMRRLECYFKDLYHNGNSNAKKAASEVHDFMHLHASDPGYNVRTVVKVGDDTYYGQAACEGKISLGTRFP